MRKHFVILLFFTLLAIIITYPLVFHLSDYVFGKGDELLISWIMNRNIHAFFNHPFSFFSANIFYPYENSLSYSDSFITSSIIGLIPWLILKEPLAVYNLNVIITITLLGFFTYLLVYFITKNVFSSLISGTSLSLSPFILGRLFQLQVVSIYWIPLSIIFFIQFLKKNNHRYLLFSCLFFVLQSANSLLPGYFLIFIYFFIFAFYIIKKGGSWKNIFNTKTVIIIFATGFILLLLGYPYLKTAKTFKYKRDIRDTIHFANRPEYFLFPNNKTRLQSFLQNSVYKNDSGPYRYDGFWGMGFLILTVISLTLSRRVIGKLKLHSKIFLSIAIFSFTLSLGPALQLFGQVIKHPFVIPLPYALFYYFFPGFQGFRNSARWEVLTIFSLVVFIGINLTLIFSKKKAKIKTTIITLLIILIIFAEVNLPFSYEKMPTTSHFPKIHQFVKLLPASSNLLFLPIYPWFIQPYSNLEFEREFYSTIHYKNMINGYSGFSPLSWEKMAIKLTFSFPDKKTVDYLKKIRITHIVISQKEYQQLAKDKYSYQNNSVLPFDQIRNKIKAFPQLKLIYQDDENIILQLI